MKKLKRTRNALYCLVAAILMAGCASERPVTPANIRSPADPWEPMNRRIDAFNTKLDNATTKPLAKGYRKVVPQFARRGVSNFYDNLLTPWTAVNNFLQGKGHDGASDVGRFLINSSFGLLGLFDVGTAAGLEEHDEDLGQTLAVWGVGAGPYVVVPFFGPSTLRDALTLPVDLFANPLTYYKHDTGRYALITLEIIDLRTGLLNAEKFLSDSSDRYITLRESYLQNRNFVIYDGNPPLDDDFYDDFEDDFEDDAADEGG